MKTNKVLLFMFLTAAVGIFLMASNLGGGNISPGGGLSKIGCGGCHDKNPSKDIRVKIDGLPDEYEPGKSYNITISIESDLNRTLALGGFDLSSDGGELSNPGAFAKVLQNKKEATHDSINKTSWTLTWTAPDDENTDEVTFDAAVLHANGNGLNDEDDKWNKTSKTIKKKGAGDVPDGNGGSGDGDGKEKEEDEGGFLPGFESQLTVGALSMTLAILFINRRVNNS